MAQAKRGAKKASTKDGAPVVASGGALRETHKTKDGAVIPKGAQTGSSTATGQAIAEEERKPIKGKERGSTQKIEGAPKTGDLGIKGASVKPQGMQKEPAVYVTNGTVEPLTIGTPSGPQPVASVAATPEAAKKLIDERREQQKHELRTTGKRLTDAQVARMTRHELHAVAHDRGYDIGEAGSRVTRASFLRAQDEDTQLEDE